jgi:hypothetical protein
VLSDIPKTLVTAGHQGNTEFVTSPWWVAKWTEDSYYMQIPPQKHLVATKWTPLKNGNLVKFV